MRDAVQVGEVPEEQDGAGQVDKCVH
jgi:hypothetical protein